MRLGTVCYLIVELVAAPATCMVLCMLPTIALAQKSFDSSERRTMAHHLPATLRRQARHAIALPPSARAYRPLAAAGTLPPGPKRNAKSVHLAQWAALPPKRTTSILGAPSPPSPSSAPLSALLPLLIGASPPLGAAGMHGRHRLMMARIDGMTSRQ